MVRSPGYPVRNPEQEEKLPPREGGRRPGDAWKPLWFKQATPPLLGGGVLAVRSIIVLRRHREVWASWGGGNHCDIYQAAHVLVQRAQLCAGEFTEHGRLWKREHPDAFPEFLARNSICLDVADDGRA